MIKCMSLLFETIRIDNSKICNIEYHNERLNWSRRELFGSENHIDLENLIIIPKDLLLGVARCRVSYESEIRKIEFMQYQPRKINSLKIVECNDVNYSFKYDNRSKLNELFELRGDADEILIVKNGFITDTSIANIVFYDGRKWVTPSTPLLKGTQRARLLKEGIIVEDEIRISELEKFNKAIAVNAMLEFNPNNYISIDKIKV